MKNRNFLLVGFVILALIMVGVVASFEIHPLSSKGTTTTTTNTSTSTSFVASSTTSQRTVDIVSSFTFNNTAAENFFQKLDTPTGMLETFSGSKTIFLADDQALDYSALIKLGNYSLANNISSSIASYGGLYGYWNDVFVFLNQYPSSWNFSMPYNYPVTVLDGYNVNVTRFTTAEGSDYKTYADLDFYTSMYFLHTNNYSGAISYFKIANSYWDGYGIADKPNNGSANGYTSYKLAIDLIVYEALMANPNTEAQIVSYNSTMTQVQSMMSKLQQSDGGVISNYEVLNGGQIQIAPGTYSNGETTSLFVLAK